MLVELRITRDEYNKLVEAFPDDAPIAHDHGAHHRIRPRRTAPLFRERQRAAHEALVGRAEAFHRLPRLSTRFFSSACSSARSRNGQ